ncbi:MAG: MBOAT family protein [Lachnospiraceae bacterium]|nr:MBOAT family protein [Lachnospiraceae bacterium]
MLFNSIHFLLFFPIVTVVYFLLPPKVRYIWLLISSYYFYMCWSKRYGILLLGVTALTYFSGILLDRIKYGERPEETKLRLKKICFGTTVILNLALLCYFKYLNYMIGLINRILAAWQTGRSVSIRDVVLPVGISFYIFQALGYVIDVYHEKIYAEKNFLRYALFVSFFPQLVAGPIERSENLLIQIGKPKKFSFENLQRGFILMLWGFFMKMVIADRAAVIVDTVYGDTTTYYGMYIVIATVLFAIQIYCDFAGYSTIARGAALVLGFRLTDNFNAPYFAGSVKEFWRRWHISLTGWFREYLYIPLGGNKKGRIRKECNLLIVFALSGLWHGSALSYVVWGILNGIYQVLSDILRLFSERIIYSTERFPEKIKFFCLLEKENGNKAKRESTPGKNFLRRVGTFALVCFSWLFFRAGGLGAALVLIKRMMYINWTVLFDYSLYSLGVPEGYFRILCYAIGVLLIVDYKKYIGTDVMEKFMGLDWWLRLSAEMFLIFTILLYGCYGELYDTTQFIYFQF